MVNKWTPKVNHLFEKSSKPSVKIGEKQRKSDYQWYFSTMSLYNELSLAMDDGIPKHMLEGNEILRLLIARICCQSLSEPFLSGSL